MKKIYFILSLALLVLFTGCQDNYTPNDIVRPLNVVQYSLTMTDVDYVTIDSIVKLPVSGPIATKKTELKAAKTAADSTKIQAIIDSLNLVYTKDSVYIKSKYVGSNKFFNSSLKAMDYIPKLLNNRYVYADLNSVIRVSYNRVDFGDTTKITAPNRFTLTDADYIQMGITLKDFSSTSNVMFYLNTYLKQKSPYALKNDVKVVSYLYYDSNKVTKKQYRILSFDGQNWVGPTDQYIYNGKEWLYDPTLFIPLVKTAVKNNPYVMAFLDYLRTHSTDATNPTQWYPKLTYTNEEHYYGFSAYYPEIICTADRTTYGDAAIKALKTNDEKYVLFKQRVAESMPLFTQVNFPLLQTEVSGLQQYVVFTIPSYYSSSKSGLYTIKMKCIVSGTEAAPAVYEVVSCDETF
jgi:rRNA maturation protein Nop10